MLRKSRSQRRASQSKSLRNQSYPKKSSQRRSRRSESELAVLRAAAHVPVIDHQLYQHQRMGVVGVATGLLVLGQDASH